MKLKTQKSGRSGTIKVANFLCSGIVPAFSGPNFYFLHCYDYSLSVKRSSPPACISIPQGIYP